tara:strand:+ start:182 stop:412 length:231 start_codon:yes stop_codon:yes gene_type:complete
MTSDGPRKVKSIFLENFMPPKLDSYKLKLLQSKVDKCPLKVNLEATVDIKLNWHQEKIEKIQLFSFILLVIKNIFK